MEKIELRKQKIKELRGELFYSEKNSKKNVDSADEKALDNYERQKGTDVKDESTDEENMSSHSPSN